MSKKTFNSPSDAHTCSLPHVVYEPEMMRQMGTLAYRKCELLPHLLHGISSGLWFLFGCAVSGGHWWFPQE